MKKNKSFTQTNFCIHSVKSWITSESLAILLLIFITVFGLMHLKWEHSKTPEVGRHYGVHLASRMHPFSTRLAKVPQRLPGCVTKCWLQASTGSTCWLGRPRGEGDRPTLEPKLISRFVTILTTLFRNLWNKLEGGFTRGVLPCSAHQFLVSAVHTLTKDWTRGLKHTKDWRAGSRVRGTNGSYTGPGFDCHPHGSL